ncbi:MAG: TetR/AcrR family transcriptional regulator [Cellulosilyticum sp.]|nr:TetR/AcrR family transcriptional regulator [Cellulosilyticum sp.]
MEKKAYHHGALKETLIIKGIEMIYEEGIESFSLRKIAAACEVSHTAPYKHFKNKEELLDAIMKYVMQDLSEEVLRVAKENPNEKCLLAIGIRYVTYMMEHKDYFNLLFLGKKQAMVTIVDNHFEYEENHPFKTFVEVASKFLEEMIPDEKVRNVAILQCWSTVHGLAHLLISGMVQYEGDYAKLAESTLLSVGVGSGVCKG